MCPFHNLWFFVSPKEDTLLDTIQFSLDTLMYALDPLLGHQTMLRIQPLLFFFILFFLLLLEQRPSYLRQNYLDYCRQQLNYYP